MSENPVSEKMPFLLINADNEVFEFHVTMSGIRISSQDIEPCDMSIEDFVSRRDLQNSQTYYIVHGRPIEMPMPLQRFIDLLRNLGHQIQQQAAVEARQQALQKTLGNR